MRIIEQTAAAKSSRVRGLATALTLLFLILFGTTAGARKKWKYRLNPPVTLDFDMEDIPEPAERERSFYYDYLYSTFSMQGKQALDVPRNFRKILRNPKESYNVNVLSEVPDSSWFTNRNTRTPLTLEQIVRGPIRHTGPADGEWEVIQGKTEGITPGFLIRDSAGDLYQLKFDSLEFPEMATGAEVIASKLYYAAGYNVKENFIVVFSKDRLSIGSKAEMKDRYGRARPIMEEDVSEILSRVARRPDGQYRAVAGKYLDGSAKGPFAFEGIRKDDPNDWIPHEHRRDLRALRIFASWVNENDFREGNTLDMYVEEDGRRFLRHYILDLGSSLGSDTYHPNIDRIGNEYQMDAAEIMKSALSFGFYRRPWTGSRHFEYPAVGFLESDIFEPKRWKPNYPVLPFENMTKQDAFWGTKLVLSFTDDQIQTAVETGKFSDPEATNQLTQVLIRRRDKIGRYWLSHLNPLDGFTVSRESNGELQLRFDDLAVKHQYASSEEHSYEFSIREEERPGRIFHRQKIAGPSIPLTLLEQRPLESGSQEVFQVSIRTFHSEGKRSGRPVHVYLLRRGDEPTVSIVGVERTD